MADCGPKGWPSLRSTISVCGAPHSVVRCPRPQFARQYGVYAAAVFDAPLAPLRGQASSWSSSPFERFDDIESRYAARMRYRNDTQAFELVLDLREPDAARDAFYLESFVQAAGLGEAATIEVQLRPTEHRAASLPAQPQLFAEAA